LLPADTISKQGGSALFYFAEQVAPAPISYLMVLAVLASTVATTQTTLLPASRLTYAMARDGVWPTIFARVHRVHLTPWVGTVIVAALAAFGVILTSLSDSVNSTFQNIISNIGVLVCFYYGITGIACAWAYRKILTKSPSHLLFAGILPLAGGLALFWVGYEVIAQAGIGPSLPVLVAMVLGIPLMVIAVARNKNGFFRAKTVSYTEGDVEAASAT
jgi:amino acid transporter